MSVCRQIRLVLWKNFTIRRRRLSRVIFELIWPLFLFLILIWVRTRNLKSYYDACYNDPKYLGSTGFLPALQSYICQWNNTCYNQSKTTDEFNGDNSFWYRFSNLTNSFLTILDETATVGYLGELVSELDSLSSYGNVWDGFVRANKSSSDFKQALPPLTIALLFANPVNLSNLHQRWFINRTRNPASNLQIAGEIYVASLQTNFSYFYQSGANITQSFCMNGEFNRTFMINPTYVNETKGILCSNLSTADLKLFLISVQKQLDAIFLKQNFSNMINSTSEIYKIPETMNKILRRMEILNGSLFPDLNNTNISVNDLCGGRNDLSSYFKSSSSSTSKTRQKRSASIDSGLNIDWNSLATDLQSYTEADMCQQRYTYNYGTVVQVMTVNRSCRCVLLDKKLNSNPIFNRFLSFTRPILYGKIYYHPSNIHYDNIIKHVNQTFESLDELVRLFRQLQLPFQSIHDSLQSACDIYSNTSSICQQLSSYETAMNVFMVLTEFIACTELNRFVPMNSEADMIREGQNKSLTDSFLAAIEFMDQISDSDDLPKHVRYKIRMTLDLVDNTFQTEDRYFSYAPRAAAIVSTKYHTYTFIYLQNAIERAIIYAHTGIDVPFGIQTQQMPYPCWINDKFINSISRMLPLLMVLSWIFTVSMNVKDIVQEKERRLKEIMKIMGLKDSVHWFTWFILCTVVMVLTAVILVLLLKFGKITYFSSIGILLVFFISYTFATINQCFLISVFFNRANLAACGAGIVYFLLYLPYTVLMNYDGQTKAWQKAVACLSSTVAFGLGCDYIGRFEGMAQGIQWNNINKSPKPNDNFSLLYCILMMLIDSIIYMFLTTYIENVFPGEFGIPQVWYYPFTKTYWFGYDVDKIRQRDGEMKSRAQQHAENNLGDIGIDIADLSKYYGNKMALKNLSVQFYRNMITAFLGRNGAGKSTTWSILTGLIPPSEGTIYVDGYDILTDIRIVRKRLGFAPQYNILFDLLTVKEHLEFFSELKDAPEESIHIETEKMLQDLSLENKAENYSTELSGGMKRKLSIAIAFIGNSTTVILDEPTAGVDPFARRAIWDLILKYKPGRTIVLSTHHLDEADLLSDRLAIISSGELKCVGTTMYLKRKYGEGYNLIIELIPSLYDIEHTLQEQNVSNSIRFVKLTEFIRQHIPDIHIKEEHGDQITYLIVDDAEHTKLFPKMLAELDENKAKYHIKSYGLSNSSLEQVFLRVADEIKRPEDYERITTWKKFLKHVKKCFGQHEQIQDPTNDNTDRNDEIDANIHSSDEWNSYAVERYTGIYFIAIQIAGLLIKRFHRTKRNTKGFIAEILLPILFILLAMLVTKLAPNLKEPPTLIIHPWYWGKPNYMFQSLSPDGASSISKSIQKTFTQSPSLGTRCIKTTMLNRRLYPCSTTDSEHVNVITSSDVMNALNEVDYNRTRISPQCDCWMKMQTCPVGGGGPEANLDITETYDILYDLQGFNITDWSVKTEYNTQYLMKRFGGFEFLSRPNTSNSYDILNETSIYQLQNLFNRTNTSQVQINATKIASLFRIYPPQASVWYNNKGWPSSVAFLNLFNNALLRALLLQNNSSTADLSSYGITAINHPLPQSDIQLDSDLLSLAAMELFTAICIIFALAFIPASFLVFLIDERTTTSKHLQFVSGIQGLTYWCGNFLWDLTNYCVSIACCMIIFLIFGIEAYVANTNFVCLLLLLFLYGFAIIPLMYTINYLFQTPSTGFVVVSSINIFIGLISTITTFTLENFSDEQDLVRINNILMKLFLVFPHYCLGRGLFDMSRTYAVNSFNIKYVALYVPKSPFEMDIVGRNMLALFLEGIAFFALAILIQYRFFIPDRGCVRVPHISKHLAEDDDVAAERKRIHSDPDNASQDILRMVDLVKVYGSIFSKNFLAVKKTCVGVKKGECFGLLGINGSGKSTTFKMLTGEISMTDGNAYINNASVIKDLDKVRRNIGYCPQFDALDSLLTAREHLYFYARVNGIKQKNISYITDCLLKQLGLTLWADRPVRQYSGGNKRKLSTAISLIGNPSVIFMDEPTTGMDVRAKRFLWNCILKLTRHDQKSVIITSHSMEECETLCNRLVIMVSGEFKCFGTVQHLKEKFGDGYTILIRTNVDIDRKFVIDYVQKDLAEAMVKEEHNKMIHLRVPTNVPLHRMFSILEKARDELKNLIEDYTVTQVTLDDVFVNFAKMQEDGHNHMSKEKVDDANTCELTHRRTNIINPM